MKHQYDCEIWQAADLLKDIHNWEDMLKGTNRDQWKEFGWDIVDPMEELVGIINEYILELTDEARIYANQVECLEDELYYLRNELEDYKEDMAVFKDGLKKFLSD